ncbi:hypothetical protein C8R45DRAFT_1161293 [Mycena sanguinolenta]|nr:hypothetical protein C8R45DRAFT_1161293 [Mycena sanguinolenta]
MATTTVDRPPHEGKIRIKMQYGAQSQLFDLRKNLELGVAMRNFAKKINQELSSLRFFYDETRVREADTPSSLDMDELDTTGGNLIDVALMQVRNSLSLISSPHSLTECA